MSTTSRPAGARTSTPRRRSSSGTSVAAYVAEAIHWFAEDEAALAESLDEADRQIDRGEFYTQEEMEAWVASLPSGR